MILVTGAKGQIGSDLVAELRRQHGDAAVVATDLSPSASNGQPAGGAYEALDVTDRERLQEVVDRYDIEAVYHLASILSAKGEQHPELAWEVNLEGLRNVLEVARRRQLKVLWPSSIAVFGPETPKVDAPQLTILEPTTMYGITKRAGELLCRYYSDRFGVDVRSLRLPGIISYSAPPGGGTTDYAVEMFYAALRGEPYTCFVSEGTRLPMMYMPDTIHAMLSLMAAPSDGLTVRTSYNVSGVSVSAGELAEAIREQEPDFVCRYEPDYRQVIADSWPDSVDDAQARGDWGWEPQYGLAALVEDMFEALRDRVGDRRASV